MAFQWIQYQYPVEQQFEKMILWVDSSCRIYFALKDKDADDWTYFSGNASHGLSSGSTLVNRGSSESSAQTNYWLATPDSNNRILAVLPVPELAKYVRVYIDDANDAPTQIYEFRPSTSFIADEIISGSLTITDEFTSPPVITVSSGGQERIKIGDLGNTFGIKGYDDSSNVIFELSDNQQMIGGARITPTTLSVGASIILDFSSKSISINATTFRSSGIQLQYNSGNPQLYVGDGTDEYLQYTASGLEISTSTEDGIIIKSGGGIKFDEGGDINFTTVDNPTACTATLIANTGSVDAGDHRYKITFVNPDGETALSPSSNPVVTNATYAQVKLTNIPISQSNTVTARKIYRTKANSPNFYFYLTTLSDNTATSYIDNISDSNLGSLRNSYTPNTTYGKIYLDNTKMLDINGKNTLIGIGAAQNITIGYANTVVGENAGFNMTVSTGNTLIGSGAGYSIDYINENANNNVLIGALAGYDLNSGDANVCVGGRAGISLSSGSNNTLLGSYAGGQNEHNNGNICIGYYAGYYGSGTASNSLYISSIQWSSTAEEQANSILYGTMSASGAASQTLRINAVTTISQDTTIMGNLTMDFDTDDLKLVDAGSTGATEQAWIEVTVGGTTGYLRVYALK
ncbi:MAG: hypothetical protein ACTSPI_12500 [Candidatus Heimdallarchaeaceae archaeon]